MIRLPDALRKANLKTRMLLQVHDELIFEVPVEELDKATKVVKDIMENAYTLLVPLATEVRVGDNWGELEKVDEPLVIIDPED